MWVRASLLLTSRRATCALRLLLLLVLVLATLEYLFGFILIASRYKPNTYTSLYNAMRPVVRIVKRVATSWHNTMPPMDPLFYFKRITKSLYIYNKTKVRHQRITKPLHKSPKLVQIFSRTATQMTDGLTLAPMRNSFVKMPLCDIPNDLGPIEANTTILELDVVQEQFLDVRWGGRYTPPNCIARHKVAIIVPYRDRTQHLAVFLNHMHPFLMKQQIAYGIFIVEQNGHKEFNRAKLMNVGFVESQKLEPGGWQCFIFHDIDLLPLDTRNMYSCPRQPRHMSASIDKHNYKLIYDELFGGVSAMTLEQFTKVNGFSNKFWGWGGEDDSMYQRLTKMNYHLGRFKMPIARYIMLNHSKSAPNPKRHRLVKKTTNKIKEDGLSTLQYEIIEVKQYHLYTHILANIDIEIKVTDVLERSWARFYELWDKILQI